MPASIIKPKTYNPADYFVVVAGIGCDWVTCRTCGWCVPISPGSVQSIGYRALSKHLLRHGVDVELRLWVEPKAE